VKVVAGIANLGPQSMLFLLGSSTTRWTVVSLYWGIFVLLPKATRYQHLLNVIALHYDMMCSNGLFTAKISSDERIAKSKIEPGCSQLI